MASFSSNAFASNANQNSGNVITDRPTTRLNAPPGGHSSFSIGGDGSQDGTPTKRNISNKMHMTSPGLLDGTHSGEIAGSSRRVYTDRNVSSVSTLMEDPGAAQNFAQPARAAAPASASSTDMIFGARTNKGSNAFASNANQNSGNIMTDHPSTRVAAPPGGGSSVQIGGGTFSEDDVVIDPFTGKRLGVGKKQMSSPQPAAEPQPRPQVAAVPLAGAPSTTTNAGHNETHGYRFHNAPQQQPLFGAAGRTAQGSNSFASGASQNTGNVITDRPTTRVHAPPGGGSSLTLG